MFGKNEFNFWMKYKDNSEDIQLYIKPLLKEILNGKTGINILDFGCGWGQVLEYIDKQSKYYGIDKNIYYKDIISGPNVINFGETIPTGEFDLIIVFLSLHYNYSYKKILKNLFSQLKSKGELNLLTFSDKYIENICTTKRKKVEKTNNKRCKITYSYGEEKVELINYFFFSNNLEKFLRKEGMTFIRREVTKDLIFYKIT